MDSFIVYSICETFSRLVTHASVRHAREKTTTEPDSPFSSAAKRAVADPHSRQIQVNSPHPGARRRLSVPDTPSLDSHREILDPCGWLAQCPPASRDDT